MSTKKGEFLCKTLTNLLVFNAVTVVNQRLFYSPLDMGVEILFFPYIVRTFCIYDTIVTIRGIHKC